MIWNKFTDNRILKTNWITPHLYSTYDVIASSVSLAFTRNLLYQVHVSIMNTDNMEIGPFPLSFRYSVSVVCDYLIKKF